jgi:hypothetical protein
LRAKRQARTSGNKRAKEYSDDKCKERYSVHNNSLDRTTNNDLSQGTLKKDKKAKAMAEKIQPRFKRYRHGGQNEEKAKNFQADWGETP